MDKSRRRFLKAASVAPLAAAGLAGVAASAKPIRRNSVYTTLRPPIRYKIGDRPILLQAKPLEYPQVSYASITCTIEDLGIGCGRTWFRKNYGYVLDFCAYTLPHSRDGVPIAPRHALDSVELSFWDGAGGQCHLARSHGDAPRLAFLQWSPTRPIRADRVSMIVTGHPNVNIHGYLLTCDYEPSVAVMEATRKDMQKKWGVYE